MNADRLLAHYEKIAEAHDAIPRLRRFVLDLAVRGKLVEQDPNDEPAEELLKRIAAEKARLLKGGEIKKSKSKQVELVELDDTEFCIPSSWCWTRLEEVTSYIQRGKSPKYASADGSPVVSQKCVQWHGLDLDKARKITYQSLVTYEDIRFLREGDLLWNSTGTGTIGRIIRLIDPPERLVCDSHVTVVRCLFVSSEYIRTWLRTGNVYGLIEERAAGSTNQVELTAQMALNQVVPVPPLAEQHRIVAKVDELMTLCDRLKEEREEREAIRDRFAAASLTRLNSPDPDPSVFQGHVTFALDNLSPLTTRPDQIKALRQTILNLAVRGKLVEQDPNDEPAEELLKRIAAEKARLLKGGEIKKSKSKQVELVELDDTEFCIPSSWCWTRLEEVTSYIQRGKSPKYASADGSPVVSQKCVQWHGLDLDKARKITYQSLVTYEDIRFLREGDLLWNSTGTGTIGRIIRLIDPPERLVCDSHVTVVRCLFVSSEYIRTWLRTGNVYGLIEERAAGSTNQVELTAQMALNQVVPVPPLAEQHRIVAKVDELMAFCDSLKANLTTGEDIRCRLLGALLHETLPPSKEQIQKDISTVAPVLSESPEVLTKSTPAGTSPE